MRVKFPLVIGVSGTHGTGKSSIFDALAFLSVPPFNLNRTQISRTAQRNLGWDSLARAGDSIENVWALQDSALTSMIQRDQEITDSGLITVVERSPLDVWAYMLMWCEKLSIDVRSDRVEEYKQRCIEATKRYSNIVIIPAVPEVPFKFDPHRGAEQFRASVEDDILRLALEILDVNSKHGGDPTDVRISYIKKITIRDRAEEVKTVIKQAGEAYMNMALYEPYRPLNKK